MTNVVIDPKKTYRTRDGREVRIYAVDGGAHGNAIHGAVRDESGRWVAEQWFHEGMYAHAGSHMKDLIEARPRFKWKGWINVYRDGQVCSQPYDTREKADAWSATGRIACVEIDIDVEEGHGL